MKYILLEYSIYGLEHHALDTVRLQKLRQSDNLLLQGNDLFIGLFLCLLRQQN